MLRSPTNGSFRKLFGRFYAVETSILADGECYFHV
ncbi:hypothetical protein EDD52_1721, partial [Primorskyibacter sedentarius]